MIGFRFSWVANIDGKSTLVSPFSLKPQLPGQELSSTCTEERHTSDKDCRCGIHFTTSLKALTSWYDWGLVASWYHTGVAERPFVLELGTPTGWTYEDGGPSIGNNTYRAQGWTRHHMWAPKEHALALRHRYKTPVIPKSPSTENLEPVLKPLGITETEFEPHKNLSERFLVALGEFSNTEAVALASRSGAQPPSPRPCGPHLDLIEESR